MKTLLKKRLSKKDREKAVLLGVVELYIKTGKPVGSNFLKEEGFDCLSSATIRNYFNKLEKGGFLKQRHSSGGRIPTALAYREYANNFLNESTLSEKEEVFIAQQLKGETKKIRNFLNQAAENLSELTNCSVFLSSPRFDQDFIQNIKLLGLDKTKLLCIIITNFGFIHSETLYTTQEINAQDIKIMEEFFLWRLGKGDRPTFTHTALKKLSQRLYNEIIVRRIVNHANFLSLDIYKTGLSKLLNYSEFKNPVKLANNLSLFEDSNRLKTILNECSKINRLTSWIGEELETFSPHITDCAVIAIPYRINQIPAGAIAIVGPMRMNYPHLFALLQTFSHYISQTLTKNVYKFKISFRKPNLEINLQKYNNSILLEDKSKEF